MAKAPNLDVVDCPGLVAASAQGRPNNVAQATAQMVKCLENEKGGGKVVYLRGGFGGEPPRELVVFYYFLPQSWTWKINLR